VLEVVDVTFEGNVVPGMRVPPTAASSNLETKVGDQRETADDVPIGATHRAVPVTPHFHLQT
jgi:hypothetical protein